MTQFSRFAKLHLDRLDIYIIEIGETNGDVFGQTLQQSELAGEFPCLGQHGRGFEPEKLTNALRPDFIFKNNGSSQVYNIAGHDARVLVEHKIVLVDIVHAYKADALYLFLMRFFFQNL